MAAPLEKVITEGSLPHHINFNRNLTSDGLLGVFVADRAGAADRDTRSILVAYFSHTKWDKTFPKSDLVTHSKVTFHNRYGITLAADMYIPKNATGSLPAIAVSGPFGAVKGTVIRPVRAEHGGKGIFDHRVRGSWNGYFHDYHIGVHLPVIDGTVCWRWES